jgi:hypothetical protein
VGPANLVLGNLWLPPSRASSFHIVTEEPALVAALSNEFLASTDIMAGFHEISLSEPLIDQASVMEKPFINMTRMADSASYPRWPLGVGYGSPRWESSNAHQYYFGADANVGTHRLRQSRVWWFPEILASFMSMACVVGKAN